MSTVSALKHKVLKSVPVLDLGFQESLKFFLKSESYCNLDFPPYIEFDSLLSIISQELTNTNIASVMNGNSVKHSDKVNHKILNSA